MAWCPVCKNEYREGITICVDCNVPLVDDLNTFNESEQNYEPLFITKEKELTEKFTAYLEYSGLHRHLVSEDEESGEYTVCVHPEDFDIAKKLYRGFAITEAANDNSNGHNSPSESDDSENSGENDEEAEYEDNENGVTKAAQNQDDNNDYFDEHEHLEPDENELINPDDIIEALDADTINEASNRTYVRKSERYNDYKSSAYTCILVGGIGVVFGILNIIGVIEFITSIFSQIVMMTMFILFLIGGICMLVHSGKIKSEIASEEAIENKIKDWLALNITPDYLNNIKDESLEDEMNYFNYGNTIRADITTEIPEAPIDMIDALVDDYLSTMD